MATLVYTFSDLYNVVSKYLGTYGSSGPIGTALDDAKEIVNDAYLRFLTPGGGYRWSFLTQDGELHTIPGEHNYQFPEGFEALLTKPAFAENTRYPPMAERDSAYLDDLRSYSVEMRAYPLFYAVRPGEFDRKLGQYWMLDLWPTPDATYTFTYKYRFMPPKLENDADLPIGGPEFSLLIKQFCLAQAESYKDRKIGVQEQKLMAMLPDMILRDNYRKTRNLGHFGCGQLTSWAFPERQPWQMPAVSPDTNA